MDGYWRTPNPKPFSAGINCGPYSKSARSIKDNSVKEIRFACPVESSDRDNSNWI